MTILRDLWTRLVYGDPAFVAAMDVLIASLRDDPGDWKADKFVLVHEASRTGIWISNSVYGVDVRLCGGAEVKPRWLVRRRLYRAYTRWAAETAVNRLRDQVEAFVRRHERVVDIRRR